MRLFLKILLVSLGCQTWRSSPSFSPPSSMTTTTPEPPTTSTLSQGLALLFFTTTDQSWRTIMSQLSFSQLDLCILIRLFVFSLQNHDGERVQHPEQHVQDRLQRVPQSCDRDGPAYGWCNLTMLTSSSNCSSISDMSMHFSQLKQMKNLMQSSVDGGRYDLVFCLLHLLSSTFLIQLGQAPRA